MKVCEVCGCSYDPEKAAEEYEEALDEASYEYYFGHNDYCAECAIEAREHDDDYDDDGPPPGCNECGGDWPNCTTSCPMYDD